VGEGNGIFIHTHKNKQDTRVLFLMIEIHLEDLATPFYCEMGRKKAKLQQTRHRENMIPRDVIGQGL